MRNLIHYFIVIALATFFAFSGYTKLFPVEAFEIILAETGWFAWSIIPYLARIIIGWEWFLAIALIINTNQKKIALAVITTLAGFSVYLLYLLFIKPDVVDCGCMGEYLALSPTQSLLKNLVLGAMAVSLYIYPQPAPFRLHIKIVVGLRLFLFLLPFIWNVIWLPTNKDQLAYKIDFTKISTVQFNGDSVDLSEGKHLLAFYSMHCKFCKLAAKKINTISISHSIKTPVYHVFFGDTKNLADFWKETGTLEIPYSVVDIITFFELSGKSLPTIYLLDNGIVVKKTNLIGLNANEITSFFEDQ